MQVVYSGQEAPNQFSKSIFLVGPTPRSTDVKSWRPEALENLKNQKYDGVVFVPEYENIEKMISSLSSGSTLYEGQIEWEHKHLNMSDAILAWVPRNMKTMPSLTTNIEFGTWLNSGKLIYGRPDNSVKNSYLDYVYKKETLRDHCKTIKECIQETLDFIGEGASRSKGERSIPLFVWRTNAFQSWYKSHLKQGNVLHDAKLLWNFRVGDKKDFPFCFSLWCKMWIKAENRYKENEFTLARNDISTIAAINKKEDILDTEILLVKEFRTPVRTSDGFIHELPGGSSFSNKEDFLQLASDELWEETGLRLNKSRFKNLCSRQLAGTFSSHHAELFLVELTNAEIAYVKKQEANNVTHGEKGSSELTYIEVRTLRDLLKEQLTDYSTLGMVCKAILS